MFNEYSLSLIRDSTPISFSSIELKKRQKDLNDKWDKVCMDHGFTNRQIFFKLFEHTFGFDRVVKFLCIWDNATRNSNSEIQMKDIINNISIGQIDSIAIIDAFKLTEDNLLIGSTSINQNAQLVEINREFIVNRRLEIIVDLFELCYQRK